MSIQNVVIDVKRPLHTTGKCTAGRQCYQLSVVWVAITSLDDVIDEETAGKPSKCPCPLLRHCMAAWLGTTLPDTRCYNLQVNTVPSVGTCRLHRERECTHVCPDGHGEVDKGSNPTFNRFVQRGTLSVEYRNSDRKATALQKIA